LKTATYKRPNSRHEDAKKKEIALGVDGRCNTSKNALEYGKSGRGREGGRLEWRKRKKRWIEPDVINCKVGARL